MTTDIKEAARASARISGTALQGLTIEGKISHYRGIAFHMQTSVDIDGIVIIAADKEALQRALHRLGVHIEVDWTKCPWVMISKDKERDHG
jgi:hypothetical protein